MINCDANNVKMKPKIQITGLKKRLSKKMSSSFANVAIFQTDHLDSLLRIHIRIFHHHDIATYLRGTIIITIITNKIIIMIVMATFLRGMGNMRRLSLKLSSRR